MGILDAKAEGGDEGALDVTTESGNGRLLDVRNIGKQFGGLAALSEVDFHVDEGEILGLIGPNGAGKTTFFNVISGLLRPTTGTVVFKGEDITSLKFHKVASKGLIRTFQLTVLFNEMTVLENVVTAHHLHYSSGWLSTLFASRNESQQMQNSAIQILEFLGLDHLKDETTQNLPHGHQRLLGVAIGMAARPELLFLDEPVTGMNPEEAQDMMGIIRRLRDDRKMTVVLVEHNVRVVMGVCDRIVVLSFGRKIAQGLPQEISDNQAVIEAYLGSGDLVAKPADD